MMIIRILHSLLKVILLGSCCNSLLAAQQSYLLLDPQGNLLVEQSSQDWMLPASLTKLLTVASSLWILGPTFQYETRFIFEPQQSTLYIYPSGDPSLKSDDFLDVIRELIGNDPLKSVLLVLPSISMALDYPPGASVEDRFEAYMPPISLWMLNGNQQVIDCEPPLNCHTDIQSLNTLSTCPEKQPPRTLWTEWSPHLTSITGCLDNPHTIWIPVRDPLHYLQALLAPADVHIQTEVVQPSSQARTFTFKSPPLSELIVPILRDSNNTYANAIFLTLAEETGERSFEQGVLSVQRLLATLTGLPADHWRIWEGSGLSRYHALKAYDLARLLHMMKQAPDSLRVPWMQALAVWGESGTLSNRKKWDPNITIRAKTGTLNSMTGLAGYIWPDSHSEDPWIVVHLYQHPDDPKRSLKQLETDWLEEILLSLRSYE